MDRESFLLLGIFVLQSAKDGLGPWCSYFTLSYLLISQVKTCIFDDSLFLSSFAEQSSSLYLFGFLFSAFRSLSFLNLNQVYEKSVTKVFRLWNAYPSL